MEKYNLSYDNCRLCARECGVNRSSGDVGFCGHNSEVRLYRASLHAWEEPIISVGRGSGTVFFSGCSLRCVFCQNKEISQGDGGRAVSTKQLSDILRRLEAAGACNINLVTPTHFSPSIIEAVSLARAEGLSLPVVYNTSSYDSRETIRALRGTVDVFLADYKYHRPDTALALSSASDYPTVALNAIREMVAISPEVVVKGGVMQSGVIIRILLLPGHVAEAKLSLGMLYREFGERVYFSLMSQYTPMEGAEPPLDRRVTRREYEELVDYAVRLGITRAFTQEYSSASREFIPDFDFSGID